MAAAREVRSVIVVSDNSLQPSHQQTRFPQNEANFD